MKIRFIACQVERQKVVKTLHFLTFAVKEQRVITESCGTPLFEREEMETGVCRGCRDGWEVKENFITPNGRVYIQSNGVAHEL